MDKPRMNLPSYAFYSHVLREYSHELMKELDDSQVEDLENIADMVYKEAYVDGFLDAMCYAGRILD